MSDSGANSTPVPAGGAENQSEQMETSGPETVERIADDLRDDVRLGHVQDDVSHVLEERLDEAGIEMRPEDIDDLAEEIEKDASS
jgi:hypothetical protein